MSLTKSSRQLGARQAAVIGLGLAIGCKGGSRSTAIQPRADVAALADATRCSGDSFRAATAAPAEGLWVTDPGSTERVAAMIGPVRITAGDTRLTRTVETIETAANGATIRHARDTAAVSLALLPPLPGALGMRSGPDGGAMNPAAVYAVTRSIVLASYEPCAVSTESPRLRYLRRSADGRIETDVMMRRSSGGNQP